jgi:SAM-dependent methyltransferase
MSAAQHSRPRVAAAHFERIYEADADPWSYRTSEYERDKYAATLDALPRGRLGRVLEVGCSIGVFTELLAPRCEQLVAIDFSARAHARASERLTGVANVELVCASFPEHVPGGHWDVVLCSEVLYYLDMSVFAQAVDWLEHRLLRGTIVLAVSWRGSGAEEPLRGDEAHELLLRRLGRWHALDARRSAYRLDRFDGDAR